MLYSIICLTKILTLETVTFLFILVGVLCINLLWYIRFTVSQEEEVHSSSWCHRCTNSAAYSSKRFKLLSAIILLCQGYCWIGKNTNKKFNWIMVLIIKTGSTLMFEFVFGFNECLWAIISLLIFGFIYGLLLHDFWIYDTNDFKSPLTPHAHEWKTWVQRPPNLFQKVEKNLSKGSQISILSES